MVYRLSNVPRRRFVRCMAAALAAPAALLRADPEVVLPRSAADLVASPAPPWEASSGADHALMQRDPEPVIRIERIDEIRNAVARINTLGRGTLEFAPGQFAIPAVTDTHTELYFANLSEFKLKGAGAEPTRLVQNISPSKAVEQLRLCAFENVDKLLLENFSVDGQRSRYILKGSPSIGENSYWKSATEAAYRHHNSNEAMNNFFLRNVGSGVVRNIHNISARGDFLNFANVGHMLIRNCDIADCGRNGITIGGVRGLEWSRNIEIDACRFRSDIDTQMIDLELHGDRQATLSQFNRNLYIHDCLFESHEPDDNVDKDQFGIVLYAVLDFRVERCDIRSPVIVRNGHGVFRDNTGGISQFTVDRYSDVEVISSRFALSPRLRKANRGQTGILVARRDEHSPLRFVLKDSDVQAQGLDSVVEIHDCPTVELANNRFDIPHDSRALLMTARAVDVRARIAGNSGLGEPRLRAQNGKNIEILPE